MIEAKKTTTENGEIALRHQLIESARPAMKILLDRRAHSSEFADLLSTQVRNKSYASVFGYKNCRSAAVIERLENL